MKKTQITYEEAAKHYHQGKVVMLSCRDETVHVTFDPKVANEEYLEDIAFAGTSTDRIPGTWYLIHDEKEGA